MFTSNMMPRYYAYNAFEYIFNDVNLVFAGVLAGLPADQQIIIYTDPVVGMDTVDKLSLWVKAN